jgi:hypothetical protein
MKKSVDEYWRGLFADMPDETLPCDFNEKVMSRVQKEVALREKKRRFYELCGYIAGGMATFAVCILIFALYDIPFELPEIVFPVFEFPKFDPEIFTSPSFTLSLQVGVIALLLLIIESTIRRFMSYRRKE